MADHVAALRRIGSAAAGAALAGVAARDVIQRKHAIRRNFPIIGRLRYVLEEVGPELRQYIVTSNDEERPFSRDQRRWVYASSKQEVNTFGFGTDNDLEDVRGLLILKQTAFPAAPPRKGTTGSAPEYLLPAAKVLGGAHRRRHAFRPQSVVNISGMSYGSLSPPAVEALNRGAALAPCLHNTGEGGLAPAHMHGGELIFQIGTGYFGCRGEDGRFSLEWLRERIAEAPVRAIEIKLSQGAKPGLGGMLPGAKVTAEIARIRGVPEGQDCVSPARHSAFGNVDELIEFVELIAQDTGLPVGIKAAVGRMELWEELARRMAETGGGPDFITVDGAEGGTGAAPLAFSDHVALPFKVGFARLFATFSAAGIADDVVFVGGGRLGLPDSALFAFALGCDMVHVGREAMLAIGHPGPALPHRRMPHGRRDAEPLAHARPGPGAEVGAGRELHPGAARRGPLALAFLRRPASRAHHARPRRDRVRPLPHRPPRGRLRLRPGVADDLGGAGGGDRGAARPARDDRPAAGAAARAGRGR